MIYQRGGPALKKGTKNWDRSILITYTFLGIYGQFFVVGWDLGHVNFWPLGLEFLVVGLILYMISIMLIIWAMIKNPFFEPSVRIQKERNHKVINSGPYKFIRHPGYLSGILWHVSMPMIFGSGLGLIYSVVLILILLLRTYLEDKTLKKELRGYSKYTTKVRFKILPGIR